MKKTKTYSEKEQKVAVSILTQFMFTKNMDEVMKEWEWAFKEFQLWHDPFTGCPCTAKEYFKLRAEYEKQLFENKYGYSE